VVHAVGDGGVLEDVERVLVPQRPRDRPPTRLIAQAEVEHVVDPGGRRRVLEVARAHVAAQAIVGDERPRAGRVDLQVGLGVDPQVALRRRRRVVVVEELLVAQAAGGAELVGLGRRLVAGLLAWHRLVGLDLLGGQREVGRQSHQRRGDDRVLLVEQVVDDAELGADVGVDDGAGRHLHSLTLDGLLRVCAAEEGSGGDAHTEGV